MEIAEVVRVMEVMRYGIHGSYKSHEVIAVGRGRGKSHENNEDTNSVQGEHASFFSEIIFYLTGWLMRNLVCIAGTNHPMVDMVTNHLASLSDNSDNNFQQHFIDSVNNDVSPVSLVKAI
ncbi:15761_t:CDS:2 [Entrophospora sp. SA101]|nr:15761_t:CDS:2 [Entrophospora sp. SA101]